ncbi:MAG: nucleoside:proton symporter [Alphaproteobacteria bacterium]|nr:nucleoside:proton symporter [Alphaproteobacteria bacterium]
MELIQSGAGLVGLLGLAWLLSEDRRALRWRPLLIALLLQIVLAALFTSLPPLKSALASLTGAVNSIAAATRAGTSFVFGYIGGGPLPFDEKSPGSSFNLAFQALPLILVMSALSSLLFHWRILPALVRAFAWGLRRTLGTGGAVGVATAANIFVGMVEAPLFARPYLARLSRGELFVVMTAGMATIAGTVLVLYAVILAPAIPDVGGHLVLASLLSAPAAILVAQVMIPDRAPGTEGDIAVPDPATSSMDAITRGTLSGVQLLVNVVAMLIVLVALVHLLNQVIALAPDVAGAPLTLQRLLGWIMAPICFLMGIPWSEAVLAGQLMGTKTVLNEFVAYLDLAGIGDEALSARSRLILTYALCGFANFGSLGIMIGGLGTMVPERRGEIVALGLRSLVSGTLATCMTGAVIGLFV